MKRLLLSVVLSLCATHASAAPITWAFDTTLRIICVDSGTACPADIQPYLPLHNSPVHGTLTFDSNAVDTTPDPTIGTYALGLWTLDLPVFNTTWTSSWGSLEIGTVDAPTLGAFPCFGCMAAFGYFSGNSNPAAPPPPNNGSQLLPFEFRTFGPQFVTDALPVGVTSFQSPGGFFVGANQIVAQPFTARAVPEPASILLVASSAGLLLARRAWRRREPRSPSSR